MSFWPYDVGLCYASVCTDETDDKATELLNAQHPTGVSSRWAVSGDETFATGESNGCPCPDQPGNRHVLFDC